MVATTSTAAIETRNTGPNDLLGLARPKFAMSASTAAENEFQWIQISMAFFLPTQEHVRAEDRGSV